MLDILQTTMGDRVLGLDHIAINVSNLGQAVEFFVSMLGFRLQSRRETRGERTGMVSAVVTNGQTTIVLAQGMEEESHVTRFVRQFGPGVDHFAIRVRELGPVMDALRERGVSFATEVVEGPFTRQVLSERAPAAGIRIELIERWGEDFADPAVERLYRIREQNDGV